MIIGKYIVLVDVVDFEDFWDFNIGDKFEVLFEKMLKLKYNGVDFVVVIDCYGVDIVCMFILFKVLLEKDLEWDDVDVEG